MTTETLPTLQRRPAVATLIQQRQGADAATLAGLYVIFLMLLPSKWVIRGVSFSLTPANLVGLLLLICWLCAQFTTTLGAAKGRTPVRTATSLYLTACLATYGYANAGFLPSDERNFADHTLVITLALVGVTYGIVDGVRNLNRLDRLLKVVVVCGAIMGVVGACQFLFKLDLTTYTNLPGLRSTSTDSAVIARNDLNRVASTTAHPIEYGVVCSMLLPLAVHYALQAKNRGLPYVRWWLCVGLIASGEAFSVSRSAVLTLAVVGLVLFWGWPNGRRFRAVLVSVGAVGVLGATTHGLVSTIYNLFAKADQDSSVQVRTHRYSQAADEIAKHFWLGRGAGTWYYPKYNAFDNQYIMSMVETGLIGTAAMVMIFVTGIYAGLRARRLSDNSGIRELGLALAAGLCSPLVGGVTFDLLSFSIVTGLTFTLIGAAGALLRISAEHSSRRRTWHRNLLRRLRVR